jgi:hypothetical protein
VLAGWLRALGVHPLAVPGDPGEAAALFRSLTAAAPVAVLADDAAGEAQVRALLPAAGLVVVTSRYQLAALAAADGALLLPLGPLDPAAATELAARITGRAAERDALAILAGYCGHLPLAIRAATARLAARPALPATAVAADLAAARSRLTALDAPGLEITVQASLDASYQALSPDAARAYRLLATGPGPDVSVPAAGALLDASEHDAGQLTVALAAASLLEEAAPGRWRFHDLVRDHARGLAERHDPNAERRAATGRAVDWYLRGSAAADLAILPGRMRIAAAFALPALAPAAFGTAAAALAWCDAERDGLLDAQRAAARLGLHAAAWQFCDTLWGWLSHRHDYPAWEAACEQAIASAQACGDPRAEACAATRLAACHIAAGDPATAAPLAEHAVDVAWAAGDLPGEGSAREHAGICALAARRYQAAVGELTRGLDCWQRVTPRHPRAEAIIHRQLGRAMLGLARPDDGYDHFETALGIFTQLGERYHQARTMYVIATYKTASTTAGAVPEAISLLECARPLLEDEDHPLAMAELLTALAEAHARTQDMSQARACLDQAMALQQALGLPDSHPARTGASLIASQLT